MRTILAFTLLVAGVSASFVPDSKIGPALAIVKRQSRIISGAIEAQIIEGIEEISQAIRDDGLDPFYIEKEHYAYELPVPKIFNAAAVLEDILSTGLSDIVISHINFSLLTFRLDFELELPHLHFSARDASGDVTLFGNTLAAAAYGSVDILDTTVVGELRVNAGAISGISFDGVTVHFSLGRIISRINLVIQDEDFSEDMNDFIVNTIPATLQEFSDEVNELFEIILWDAIIENIDL